MRTRNFAYLARGPFKSALIIFHGHATSLFRLNGLSNHPVLYQIIDDVIRRPAARSLWLQGILPCHFHSLLKAAFNQVLGTRFCWRLFYHAISWGQSAPTLAIWMGFERLNLLFLNKFERNTTFSHIVPFLFSYFHSTNEISSCKRSSVAKNTNASAKTFYVHKKADSRKRGILKHAPEYRNNVNVWFWLCLSLIWLPWLLSTMESHAFSHHLGFGNDMQIRAHAGKQVV